jgi:hypothetical protein
VALSEAHAIWRIILSLLGAAIGALIFVAFSSERVRQWFLRTAGALRGHPERLIDRRRLLPG